MFFYIDSFQTLFLLANTVVQGDILLNGRPVGPFMHRLSGFVHQDDMFMSTLNVKEHLYFMVSVNTDIILVNNYKKYNTDFRPAFVSTAEPPRPNVTNSYPICCVKLVYRRVRILESAVVKMPTKCYPVVRKSVWPLPPNFLPSPPFCSVTNQPLDWTRTAPSSWSKR